jgi:hypothetical protein
MKWLAFFVLTGIVAIGCSPASKPAEDPAAAPKPTATAAPAPPSGNGGGIAPLTSGAVGGITPVTGAENLGDGTGGGIGNAAKDKARSVAGAASSPSTGQGSEE